jgi:hypothetical protein
MNFFRELSRMRSVFREEGLLHFPNMKPAGYTDKVWQAIVKKETEKKNDI